MRKVHWSVWGLLGFFGMLAVGLWIDAHWLPGVGVTTPVTIVSTPLPIRRVERQIEPSRPTPAEVGSPCDPVPPNLDDPVEGSSPACPSPGANADDAALVEDLNCMGIAISDGPELMPEPELVPAPEPLGPSESERHPIEVPIDMAAAELPPAREPSATKESTTDRYGSQPQPLPPALDDPAIRDFMEMWRVRAEGSPDLTPRASEVAEAIRRIRDMDRAPPVPDLPPPPLPPSTTIEPPSPPAPPVPLPAVSRLASPDQIDALRMASRQLDETANQLEQQGLYERADQMRQLAQELRVDARKETRQPTAPQYMPVLPVPEGR